MRLLRFVAVACMVAVSVASLGCGETAEPAAMKKDMPSTSSSATAVTETPETATKTGTTPVSLAITGMS